MTGDNTTHVFMKDGISLSMTVLRHAVDTLRVRMEVRIDGELVSDVVLDLLSQKDRYSFTQEAGKRAPDIDWSIVLTEAQADLLTALGTHPPTQTQEDGAQCITPEPLRRAIAPSAPYPIDALGSIAGDMVRVLHQIGKAPIALCAQSVLVAMSQAAQGHANVLNDGREHPLSLYAVTGAESGERKTAIDHDATRQQAQHQKALNKVHQHQLLDYNNRLDAWARAREDALKKEKGAEAKRIALDLLGEKPTPPLDPMLIVSEPTYEGLVKMLERGQPSIAMFSNEGGRFLGGHAMGDSQRIKTLGSLNSLWDGKPIDRVRAGDGATLLYDKRLSMHLMVQPGLLTSLLGNAEARDMGFLARCLTAFPESTIGTRMYQSLNIQESLEAKAFWQRIADLLESQRDDVPENTGLRTLPLTQKAKAAWIKFHNHVEALLADGKAYAPIRAFGAKAAEHALRIAGVLTLMENPEARHIDRCVVNGIELVQFYLSEWLRLEPIGTENPDIVLAEKLLAWAQKYDYIYPRLVYYVGPYGIRDKQTALRILAILEEHHWLKRVRGGKEIDGAIRGDAWEVCHA